MKKILIIIDNENLYNGFQKIILKKKSSDFNFDIKSSYNNNGLLNKCKDCQFIKPLNLSKDYKEIILKYSLVLSIHCKQLFPPELINKIRCINIHPGYNPYNRGVFPQVFSIINKKPVGVTIHIMDEQIDHGPIIYRNEVPIYAWDTSKDVYRRILIKELQLIEEHLEDILYEKYEIINPENSENINYLKDFKELCKINLKETTSFEKVIDRLRALTHEGYDNAYFLDKNGKKIWIKIILKPDS